MTTSAAYRSTSVASIKPAQHCSPSAHGEDLSSNLGDGAEYVLPGGRQSLSGYGGSMGRP